MMTDLHPEVTGMKFFQLSLIPEPLGPLYRAAREERKLTLEQAALAVRIPVRILGLLEGESLPEEGIMRLHAVTYARFLGIDPKDIRGSLPPLPPIAAPGKDYIGRLSVAPKLDWRTPFEILAPLGRTVLYFLIAVLVIGTWGAVRHLSRVRTIPWVTSATPQPTPMP